MKITFSYYPRGQPAVQLTILYVPKRDEYKLQFGGFLDTETNTALVDWPTLKIFKDGEIKDKKIAFANLKPIDEQENYLQLKHF